MVKSRSIIIFKVSRLEIGPNLVFFFQKFAISSSNTTTKSKKKLFTDINIESSMEVGLNLIDANTPLDTPCISGCDSFPNGQVILCDNLHNRIILLDKTFEMKETLVLQKLSDDDDDAWPYDVSVINDKMAAVTLPELMKIQCIQVSPNLKIGHELVTFEKECYGIHVSGTEIYVTLHNNPGDGEVRVLNMQGELKRKLGIHQSGAFMFQRPYHITVCSTSGKIYVTDSITCMVTCLTQDGSVVYKYKDENLNRPKGVCVDSEDNIMICGNSSDNIQVVSSSGHIVRTLLSSKDGLDCPYAVAYREIGNTLIVGCRHKKLHVFYV